MNFISSEDGASFTWDRQLVMKNTDAENSAEEGLEEIFERTYGKGSFHRGREYSYYTGQSREAENYDASFGYAPDFAGDGRASREGGCSFELKEKFLIVDGYNIIFAWEELKLLAKDNIDAARDRLADILCNYQGYRAVKLLLVFDGYRVKGNCGEAVKYHNIDIVYTREGESADQYIEKKVLEAGKVYDITVATSDRLEQMSIFSHGARRLSASDFYAEVEAMSEELRRKYLKRTPVQGSGLFTLPVQDLDTQEKTENE